MKAAAAAGLFAVQRCRVCGHVQYPPRACCAACLADDPAWEAAAVRPGTVLARTVLHHSHEEMFRARLPLALALVRLAEGPVVLCFAPDRPAIGNAVQVRAALDATGHAVLEAR